MVRPASGPSTTTASSASPDPSRSSSRSSARRMGCSTTRWRILVEVLLVGDAAFDEDVGEDDQILVGAREVLLELHQAALEGAQLDLEGHAGPLRLAHPQGEVRQEGDDQEDEDRSHRGARRLGGQPARPV